MGKPVTKLKSIEDTAIGLFASQGIKQVTIKDIAKEAGCSEGALYRHYTGKDEMAWVLYSREVKKFGGLLKGVLKGKGTYAERLSSAVQLFYAFFDKDPVTFTFILLSEHNFPSHNRIDSQINPHNLVFEFVDDGVKGGAFNIGDSNLGAAMVLGLVLQPATLRATGKLKGRMGDKISDVVEACLRVLKVKDRRAAKARRREDKESGVRSQKSEEK
ncbi:MAG TPA: TetR/AcrR family transcriptional regulator [Thermodesulfobacteriota bacterium]|nr:TetR/AcrR family transcriptional regulator [Thermodesulfobacteriota bacterium]